MTTRLRDIANGIRTTNNGATMRSFDILFDREEDFRLVWNSYVLTPSLISRLYGVPADTVHVFD